MEIDTKTGAVLVDPAWIKAWNEMYLGVDAELLKAKSWAADLPQAKKKTKRGIRLFLGNWIRRSCPLRPAIRDAKLVPERIESVPLETRQGFLKTLKGLVGL